MRRRSPWLPVCDSSRGANDLVKNPEWWDTATGGPYIDKLHFPILLDEDTAWLEFRKGSLDCTQVPSGQIAASKAMPEVASGAWTAKTWPTLAVTFIGFNLKDATLGGERSLALRQLLSCACDRNAAINIVGEGVDTVATGLVPTGVPGSGHATLPYPDDPARAGELRSQLGEVPPLRLWYPTGSTLQRQLEASQAGWSAHGIDVELTNFEWGTYLAKVSEGAEDEMFVSAWVADYPSMDSFLYPLFQSTQSPTGSFTFYNNPQVDELLIRARSTVDEAKRLQLYAQAEQQILADAPVIPVSFGRAFRITDNRIANFALSPLMTVDMWTLWVK